MKRTNWSNVTAGDVVKFRYKGLRTGKSRLRTCLILNERHMYKKKNGGTVKLVHALQLNAIPRVSGTTPLKENQIRRVLKKTGKVELREGNYAIDIKRQTSRTTYGKIANLVSTYGIYRTFSFNRLKRNAVFLDEEFDWPEELVKDLQQVEPQVDEDEI